jgi:hypothetical protein
MDNRKDSISGAHSTNILQPLIPHMPVPPKEVCPFSAQQSLGCPTSLPGLQQQAGPEVSEHCSCSLAPTKSIPNNSLAQRTSHGPDNPLLQSLSKLTRYTNQKGWGNRLQKGEMVVSRITECMSEMVMESLTG